MAKVITFSRVYPSYHPRAGEPTGFIEKIYAGLADLQPDFKIPNDANEFWDWHEYYNCRVPKFHTIRAGHRFKVGDYFSPRVWSGRPYNSKQIIIAPDIEVQKTWSLSKDLLGGEIRLNGVELKEPLAKVVANNDGLTLKDFKGWFNKPFTGQIICWNENINY